MARSDLVKLAERELKPYGIVGKDISTRAIGSNAYELIWTYNGESHRLNLPGEVSDKRDVSIFRSNLEKQLREFGVKLLDPSANRVNIEEQLEGIRDELIAGRDRYSNIEEMFLEWAAGQEKKLNAFSEDILARVANQDTLIAAALRKNTDLEPHTTQPIVPQVPAVQHSAPKRSDIKEQPKPKGLDALEQVRAQKIAEVLREIDAEFAMDEFDWRILYFLSRCGPQTAHELKEAGVWICADSAFGHLQGMQARGLVQYAVSSAKWTITKKAITELEDELHGEPEPQNGASEEGLTEALAFARGEPNHAKSVAPKQPIEAQKPALSIVPKAPRILKAVESSRNEPVKLTYVEKSMLALLKKDMTITELREVIGHTSGQQSLINMLRRCESTNGYIKYHYDENRIYRITEAGRAYITRAYPSLALAS